jgi:hypothetical protein
MHYCVLMGVFNPKYVISFGFVILIFSNFLFNISGSWETLETKPKARGVDIRLELLKFYKNYSANLMHLVVYGKGKCCNLVHWSK